MEILKNTIMDKPTYVTVTAIEFLADLGQWNPGDIINRTIMDPPPSYMIEIEGELIVNTTEWKWVIK